jgi:uncharacterized linocin/CFP29 family protein
MHADLANLGWTEEQWNRIASVVAEEGQKARVAAQVLPTAGPEDPQVIAVPRFALGYGDNPLPPNTAPHGAKQRLEVDSEPDLPLTTIAVNVHLRTAEAADPQLRAAIVMFRRAANVIARLEDMLVFYGRDAKGNIDRPGGVGLTNDVYTVTGKHDAERPKGLFTAVQKPKQAPAATPPTSAQAGTAPTSVQAGKEVFEKIVAAITDLESDGHTGPYGCLLGKDLFAAACSPSDSYVLARDRILPFLQGPLLRSSALAPNQGVVVSLSGEPVEIVVASDLSVRYLQTTLEPRFVFRVSERVAVRIKDGSAVQLLNP